MSGVVAFIHRTSEADSQGPGVQGHPGLYERQPQGKKNPKHTPGKLSGKDRKHIDWLKSRNIKEAADVTGEGPARARVARLRSWSGCILQA